MKKNKYWAFVCLGVVVVAQGCAQVLGFEDENRPDFGIACTTPATCPGVDDACNTRICVSGTCGIEFAPKGALCQVSNSCDGAGKCLRANGVQCDKDEQEPQCISGFCVDGVCCDKACDGTCEACDLANSKGVCSLVENGADDECANGVCNGVGVCIYELGQTCFEGTNCISSFCLDGSCCSTANCFVVGASCETGTCQCPGTNPLTCDNVCKDGSRDSENCNMCGNICDLTKNIGCVDSKCQDLTWALWPMPHTPGMGLPETDYEVDAAKGIVFDKVTKLIWQREVDSMEFTWEAAKAYCKGLKLAGFDDWRLPTRIELVSIVDYKKKNPAIDEVAFPMTSADLFWTSSLWVGSSFAAWIVYFDFGFVYYGGVAYSNRVRCVR